MKFLIVLVIFVVAVSCQISSPVDYSHPDHPGKCLFEGNPLTVGTHDNVDTKSCFKFECLENGMGTQQYCPLTGYPPNCVINEDLTKPYPACCEKNAKCT